MFELVLIGLWSHPCWTLYRNSLRTDRLKWFGKLRDTLSLMKASMTACQREEEESINKFYIILSTTRDASLCSPQVYFV